jgi:hypothetical protein
MLLLYYNMAENLRPHVQAKPIVLKSPPSSALKGKSGASSLGMSKISGAAKGSS